MKYYMVSFCYTGPKSNFGLDNSAKKLEEVIKEIDHFMTIAGIKYKNAYAWTDGSLFYYVYASEAQMEELEKQYDNPQDICIDTCTEIPDDYLTYKLGKDYQRKAIKELF